jgi:hypothetical protein
MLAFEVRLEGHLKGKGLRQYDFFGKIGLNLSAFAIQG